MSYTVNTSPRRCVGLSPTETVIGQLILTFLLTSIDKYPPGV